MALLSIPPELTEDILLFCDPLELATLAQTSRTFRYFIYGKGHEHIWRILFLSYPLDDPRSCVDYLDRPVVPEGDDIDWRMELQRVIRARTVSLNPACCRKGEAGAIFQTLLDFAARYSTKRLITAVRAANLQLLLKLAPALLDYDGWDLDAREEKLHAQLHTIYGVTSKDRTGNRLSMSRAYLYNLAHYEHGNEFGPFEFDGSGRVNWLHMQAIQHVISMQVHNADGEDVIPGRSVYDLTAVACWPTERRSLDNGAASKDWAGVSGWWRVNFAFCDHRELLAFNVMNMGSQTPNTAIFDDPEFSEMFRSLHFIFHVTSVRPNPEHPSYPSIYFIGEAEQGVVVISGNVKMSRDGVIRWRLIHSGEGGIAVWSTEGIQIGHVRGSYGILGIWTTADHDDSDPVGPLYMVRSRQHA